MTRTISLDPYEGGARRPETRYPGRVTTDIATRPGGNQRIATGTLLVGLLVSSASSDVSAQPTKLAAGPAMPAALSPEPADDTVDNGEPDFVEERIDKVPETHILFETSLAMLAMPAAELCPKADACSPAEASVGFGLAALGRWKDFGFGGGFTWAFGLLPTEVALADSPLLREHGRSYLVIEGHFRYYLPHWHSWEWWLGANLGGVVINDSFTTLADREPYADTDLIGPKAVTLRSEGASLSLGAGGHWRFTEQFVFGTHLRYGNWLLPVERRTTPLGDLASLAGRIDVIDVGVMVGTLLPM